MILKRDFESLGASATHGDQAKGGTADSPPSHAEALDMLIIGAGFSGIWLLHHLRKRGFRAKIIEAGADLGGVWHWNRYPGARVDSQYPIYALSIPEVYRDWTWTSHYPDHVELRRYFDHIEETLEIKQDCFFNTEVVAADWDDVRYCWTVMCSTGLTIQAYFLSACTGFATKRAFPDWEGLDLFEGTIYHSSFWPEDGVDVEGKRVAVIGTGSTGVQLTQEWAQEIGPDGNLKMFQRTPNFACPMNQHHMSEEEQQQEDQVSRFAMRDTFYGGFLWQTSDSWTTNSTPAERNEFYWKLWRMAYNFWRDRVRERVRDNRKQQLLAPSEPPHAFGGKRVSLEQTFYDQFNKPNVDVVDLRNNPITRLVSNGVVQEDGTFHALDAIALATGFDAITGGLKKIKIAGVNQELLSDRWRDGTRTYLGMTSANFPNFFFTYGPQAPTAFSNGPTCIEIQGNWIVELLTDMRRRQKHRIEATEAAEALWNAAVAQAISGSLRETTDSWYNGANIPGKVREQLNYAGGIPRYKGILEDVRGDEYRGFKIT